MTQNRWTYDIESFPNFFSAIFWNKKEKLKFVIHEKRNDLKFLIRWISKQKDLVLVGFNSNSYDNTIINYLIANFNTLSSLSSDDLTSRIKRLSNYIIDYDQQTKPIQKIVRDLRSHSFYKSIDLLEVIREGYSTKSLKGVAINLKWPRIQDLPYEHTRQIKSEEVALLLEYNFNDVAITNRLLDHLKDRLEMREILSEIFKVNLLSDADSTIAKTLFNKFYSEISGESIEDFKYKRTKRTELILGDIILDWVKFKTPELQEYLEKLRKVRVWNIERKELKEGYEEDEFGNRKKKKKTTAVQFDIPKLEYNGMVYSIGLGGIHSQDDSRIFIPKEDEILLDVDVASQYPNRILKSKIVPAHLNADTVVEVLQFMVDLRLQKKSEGKINKIARIIAEGLKISVNTVYGLYNFAYYFLYDPLATYKVTINNQLAILMLIEQLNNEGINVISANTDGIICYTNNSNIDLIRQIYREWEIKTGFTLEETNYSKYIRRDINNYITIKTDGEVKNKGIFIPQNGILKGYDKPIVAIALQEYFLYGIKPEEVIMNLGYQYKFVNPEVPKGEIRETDIYDYCMAKKVGDTFDKAIFRSTEGVETEMQKNIRYYASTSGGSLYKTKGDSLHNLLTGSLITVFNDFEKKDDYQINFKYYLDETYKIIYKIEGKTWIDSDKLDAKLEKTKEAYEKVTKLILEMREKMERTGKELKSYKTQLSRGIKLEEELNHLTNLKNEQR